MLREQMWPGSNVVRGDDSNQSPNGAYEWRAIRREDNGEMFQSCSTWNVMAPAEVTSDPFTPKGKRTTRSEKVLNGSKRGGARARS